MSAFHEQLQEHAALYVSGALTERERVQFEQILRFHDELRAFVSSLEEAAAKTAFAPDQLTSTLDSALKDRLLHQVQDRVQRAPEESFVITTPDGYVDWINPAFSGMCGYKLEELRGKKLGPILQGELTDKHVAERMRQAVHERKPCSEALINYHKDGTPYWVSINITPIFDQAGHFLCFIARELELPERSIAA